MDFDGRWGDWRGGVADASGYGFRPNERLDSDVAYLLSFGWFHAELLFQLCELG
jgi:hypothetical protein